MSFRDLTVSTSLKLGIQGGTPCLTFLHVFWGPNSDFPVCKIDAFPTDPPPLTESQKPGWNETHHMVKDDLELPMILLPPAPVYWIYNQVSPYPSWFLNSESSLPGRLESSLTDSWLSYWPLLWDVKKLLLISSNVTLDTTMGAVLTSSRGRNRAEK